MKQALQLSETFTLAALYGAWIRTEESHGCAGVDAVTLSRFNDYLDTELNRLTEELIADAYRELQRSSMFVRNRQSTRANSVRG